ncbi:hypothetical protein M432DRAFT_628747 [Thermoascus aurantiacus ATCC 26904]
MARTCRGLYEVLDPYLYRHNARQSRSSALLWAADHRQEATARKALEAGASPQVRRGHTPFSAALMYGHDQIVRLLVAEMVLILSFTTNMAIRR